MATYTHSIPQMLTRAPAARGATIPATPMAAKFAALAFRSMLRPTTSTVSAKMAGSLTASTTPTASATARTCHNLTWSVKMSTASTSAIPACASPPPITSLRRDTLSARTPPRVLKLTSPRPPIPAAAPTQNAELDTVSASQPCATMNKTPPMAPTAPLAQSSLN